MRVAALVLLCGCESFFPLELEPRCTQEDFAGSAVDSELWTVFGTPMVSNDTLRIDLPSNVAGAAYSGIKSRRPYQLEEATVTIQVVQAPNPVANTDIGLRIGVDEQNGYDMGVEGGTMYLGTLVDGTFNNITVTYNSATDVFWRIRTDPASVFFETSQDGVTFIGRHVADASLVGSEMFVTYAAGTYDPGATDPGSAVIEQITIDTSECNP